MLPITAITLKTVEALPPGTLSTQQLGAIADQLAANEQAAAAKGGGAFNILYPAVATAVAGPIAGGLAAGALAYYEKKDVAAAKEVIGQLTPWHEAAALETAQEARAQWETGLAGFSGGLQTQLATFGSQLAELQRTSGGGFSGMTRQATSAGFSYPTRAGGSIGAALQRAYSELSVGIRRRRVRQTWSWGTIG